jgi:hypothetical protein
MLQHQKILWKDICFQDPPEAPQEAQLGIEFPFQMYQLTLLQNVIIHRRINVYFRVVKLTFRREW